MIRLLLKNRTAFLLFSLLLLTLIFPVKQSFARDKADAILGEWLTEKKDSKVMIYKVGDSYFGKISWLKEPLRNGKPKLDDKNPDVSKQNTPLMGLNLLKNFKFVKENKWGSGQIYNPRDGKEYHCNLTLTDNNTLNVRGYIGISLIGKTEIWTR
jgi:uncharacterized protein (DUF2147 family)